MVATLAVSTMLALGGAGECQTTACHRRVARKQVRQKWKRTVRAYGQSTLAARARCEGSGNYKLRFANGFWFVHQFEARAWAASGGRVRGGEPQGAWSYHPGKLELDYRAARWDALHGGDPWPNCP